jgi:hypothetical protein
VVDVLIFLLSEEEIEIAEIKKKHNYNREVLKSY